MIQSLHRYSLQLITIHLTTCLTSTLYSFISVFLSLQHGLAQSSIIQSSSMPKPPCNCCDMAKGLKQPPLRTGFFSASTGHAAWPQPPRYSFLHLFTPSYESFNGSVETKETPLLFKQQDVATHRHAHPNVNQLPRTSKQVEDFLSSKGPQVRLPVKREGNLHS